MEVLSNTFANHQSPPSPEDRAYKVAQNLEASFLAEMLKTAGFGKARSSFGGGIGEDQFASFLVQEQAKNMVKAGGIGLAQSIYESILERD